MCRVIFQEYPKFPGLVYCIILSGLCGKVLLHKWINTDEYFYIHAGMILREKWSTLSILCFSSNSNLAVCKSFKTMLQTVSFRILFSLVYFKHKDGQRGWNIPACISSMERYIKWWVENWIKERQKASIQVVLPKIERLLIDKIGKRSFWLSAVQEAIGKKWLCVCVGGCVYMKGKNIYSILQWGNNFKSENVHHKIIQFFFILV